MKVIRATWSDAINVMKLGNYSARIEYDAELDTFRGEVIGLNGSAFFYGRDPRELRAEFKMSLKSFLEDCEKKGVEPRRSYSARFNLRIPSELHEQLAITAQAAGKSVNSLAQEALFELVGSFGRVNKNFHQTSR